MGGGRRWWVDMKRGKGAVHAARTHKPPAETAQEVGMKRSIEMNKTNERGNTEYLTDDN